MSEITIGTSRGKVERKIKFRANHRERMFAITFLSDLLALMISTTLVHLLIYRSVHFETIRMGEFGDLLFAVICLSLFMTTKLYPGIGLNPALEMKTVDAQEHPLGVLWSAKLYEVQKYLSLTNHAYSALIVVMNKAKYDALPPDQQKALVEAAREAGMYQRKLNNDNMAKIVADVKKAGMQVIEKVDGGPFLEATKPGRDTFTAKFGGADIIKAIDAVRDTK